MGLRKLIYIPSEEMWDSIKKQGKKENRSASNYLVNLHTASLGYKDSAKPAQPEKYESHKPIESGIPEKEPEKSKVIKEARKKIEGMVKAEKKIKIIIEKKPAIDRSWDTDLSRPKGSDGKKK